MPCLRKDIRSNPRHERPFPGRSASTVPLPRVNSIKSGSPTGAKYEKLSKKNIIDLEAPPLAEMEKQEEMAEKMAIMYGGKLD